MKSISLLLAFNPCFKRQLEKKIVNTGTGVMDMHHSKFKGGASRTRVVMQIVVHGLFLNSSSS